LETKEDLTNQDAKQRIGLIWDWPCFSRGPHIRSPARGGASTNESEEGYPFWPVCIRFCWFVSAFARNT
jgi:hypothetical protein